jgi:ATP-dependent Clp protease ATP-binding subunit ClpA
LALMEVALTAELGRRGEDQPAPPLSREHVTQVIAQWTGRAVPDVPAPRVIEADSLAVALAAVADHEDQPGAAGVVAVAHRSDQEPVGHASSILLTGPTADERRRVASLLAERIYGDAQALIAIDGATFADPAAAGRLVRVPPGWVWHSTDNSLAESLRPAPALLMLDNLDQADPAFLAMLGQLLQEGHLADRNGYRLDVRRTLLVLACASDCPAARTLQGLTDLALVCATPSEPAGKAEAST